MLKLNLIFRNFEIRTIEDLPIKDPLVSVPMIQAPNDMPFNQFLDLLKQESFKMDIEGAKAAYGIERAYISKDSFDNLEPEQQEELDDAMFAIDLKLTLYNGDLFFGKGGLYNKSLILI